MAFAIGKKIEGIFFSSVTSVFHCLPILKIPLSSAGEAELTRCRPSVCSAHRLFAIPKEYTVRFSVL